MRRKLWDKNKTKSKKEVCEIFDLSIDKLPNKGFMSIQHFINEGFDFLYDTFDEVVNNHEQEINFGFNKEYICVEFNENNIIFHSNTEVCLKFLMKKEIRINKLSSFDFGLSLVEEIISLKEKNWKFTNNSISVKLSLVDFIFESMSFFEDCIKWSRKSSKLKKSINEIVFEILKNYKIYINKIDQNDGEIIKKLSHSNFEDFINQVIKKHFDFLNSLGYKKIVFTKTRSIGLFGTPIYEIKKEIRDIDFDKFKKEIWNGIYSCGESIKNPKFIYKFMYFTRLEYNKRYIDICSSPFDSCGFSQDPSPEDYTNYVELSKKELNFLFKKFN